MAHPTKGFTTQRIVEISDTEWDHDNEAIKFDADALIWRDGKPYLVVEMDGTWHLMLASGDERRGWRPFHVEVTGHAYRPIHPQMTADDVDHATYALDDGTHWLFAHCSPAEHEAFAAEVEQFTYGLFAEAVDRALRVAAASTDTASITANAAKAAALIDLAGQAGRRAHTLVILSTLGAYHRDRWTDHRRLLALAAINYIRTAWEANPSRTLHVTRVKSAADEIVRHHTAERSIEWRHVRAAALAAREAEREAAADPGPLDVPDDTSGDESGS